MTWRGVAWRGRATSWCSKTSRRKPQQLTCTFETDILATDVVHQQLGGSFLVREMGPASVKGKAQQLVTYAIDGPA